MASRSGKASDLVSAGPDSGSAEGLDALYRRYRESLRRRILRRFGAGPPDPEDAVQAAFEGYATRDDRDAIVDPEAFLYRSASNFVLEHHRRAKVRVSHADSEYQSADRADDVTAERVLSAKQRLEILDRTIRTMDERRREVLILHRIHGLSYAEIARRLGRSPTLTKMLVAEALVLCERALRDADGGKDER